MIYFEVKSKFGKKIIVTKQRWGLISTINHPIVKGKEKEIIESISNPDEIRLSKTDAKVYLYYKHKKNVKADLELESPIRKHMCELTFEDGKLKLTNEHPVYTNPGWKSINPEETYKENPMLYFVDKLEAGDEVLFNGGEYKEVVDINCWNETVQTYNLKNVEKFNNYYAGDVLVHNKAQ